VGGRFDRHFGRILGHFKLILLFLLLLAVSVQAEVPMMINYQGTVTDATGSPIDGAGYFKFAIIDQPGGSATAAYWVNSGTISLTEPAEAVQVTVTNGVFSVKLGDTGITNMAALAESIFNNSSLYLRVWFSTTNSNFEQFDSDIQLVSAGFSIKSAVADRALTADEVTDLNTAGIQARVTGTCNTNQTIIGINQDGSVQCDTDDGQTYTAGSGISISSGVISVVTAGLNADTLDFLNSSDFASSSHNHDSAYSLLGHSHSITSTEIVDGTIMNADINASAAISASKIDRTNLDADTLDGINSSGFATSGHPHNYAGSSTPGGPASDLNCAPACVSGTEIAANAIGGSHLATGYVSIPASSFKSSSPATCPRSSPIWKRPRRGSWP